MAEETTPIDHKDLGDFSVGKQTKTLYWNSKAVKTEVFFTKFQKFVMGLIAIIGIAGTLMGAIVGFTEFNKEFCIVESTSCKEKQPSPKNGHTDGAAITLPQGKLKQ